MQLTDSLLAEFRFSVPLIKKCNLKESRAFYYPPAFIKINNTWAYYRILLDLRLSVKLLFMVISNSRNSCYNSLQIFHHLLLRLKD